MISSTAMKNVWLSMEHQAILWCNQLVVQVSWSLFCEEHKLVSPLWDSYRFYSYLGIAYAT